MKRERKPKRRRAAPLGERPRKDEHGDYSRANPPMARRGAAEVFFSVVLKREKPPPLARFQSRFLSRSLSRFSLASQPTTRPTDDCLRPSPPVLNPFFLTMAAFAAGVGVSPSPKASPQGGLPGVRRGLSTSHQTVLNSLAAARPVVASASTLRLQTGLPTARYLRPFERPPILAPSTTLFTTLRSRSRAVSP